MTKRRRRHAVTGLSIDDEVPVTVRIPKGGSVMVVLARVGENMWCASFDPPEETIRHLRAALRQLEEQEGQ